MISKFVWLIYLHFCILKHRLFTIRFIKIFFFFFFFNNTKTLPIKMFGFSNDIQFFLPKVFKFRMVAIFSLKLSLHRYHLCFIVLDESNQVWPKVSDNLCIKVLTGTLFHLCLCQVWWIKPKLAWRRSFLMEMCTNTEKPAALYFVGNKAKGRISKRVLQEHKARQIFRKTNISKSLIRTRTRAYQGVRNVRFSENLVCFVFLKHPFWNSPFCLITDAL